MTKSTFLAAFLPGCISCLVTIGGAWAQTTEQAPPAPEVASEATLQPVAATVQLPATPPVQEKYLKIVPAPQTSSGQLLLPASFLQNQMGIAIDTLSATSWKLSWFGQDVQMTLGNKAAMSGTTAIAMTAAPAIINGQPYFPWDGLATAWKLEGKLVNSPTQGQLLWLHYPAAFLDAIRYSTSAEKFRVVYEFSNPTFIQAQSQSGGPVFSLAAARRGGAAAIPSQKDPGDHLISRLVTSSGDWKASLKVLLRYPAPVSWFTMTNPPRLVVDVQRNFEEVSTKTLGNGLTYQRIRRGLWRGPQLLYVVRADPSAGWRLSVANGGYSVLQRDYTSHLAKLHGAPVAVNGGFFAYDGAAVGAVKVQGEWLRLPWAGRSVIGMTGDGNVKIGQIKVSPSVRFGNGKQYTLANLNGYPKAGHISALSRHFANSYTLKPGEMALVVKNGVVTSRPGGGKIEIPEDTFLLVASGGARPALEAVQRGTSAQLQFAAPGWENYSSILGAGPQLVDNGQVHVSSEGFRSDVTSGAGPRTAVGVDKNGNYLVVVADGRKPTRSVGLTLNELGATMLNLGAVDAINFDGGGSSAMAINGNLVNSPSDGHERQVSNVVMILQP